MAARGSGKSSGGNCAAWCACPPGSRTPTLGMGKSSGGSCAAWWPLWSFKADRGRGASSGGGCAPCRRCSLGSSAPPSSSASGAARREGSPTSFRRRRSSRMTSDNPVSRRLVRSFWMSRALRRTASMDSSAPATPLASPSNIGGGSTMNWWPSSGGGGFAFGVRLAALPSRDEELACAADRPLGALAQEMPELDLPNAAEFACCTWSSILCKDWTINFRTSMQSFTVATFVPRSRRTTLMNCSKVISASASLPPNRSSKM
mmetsp:Transcript_57700/g.167137  ORF Transcript_57700/g.167137 Transcript_57700/m.167137 type:complete len:261 (-) Transcript_57700:1331-2113(-)